MGTGWDFGCVVASAVDVDVGVDDVVDAGAPVNSFCFWLPLLFGGGAFRVWANPAKV